MKTGTYTLDEILQNAPIIGHNVYHLKNSLEMCRGSNVTIVCSINEENGKIKGYDRNERIFLEIDKTKRTVIIPKEHRCIYEGLSEQAKRNLRDSVKVLRICYMSNARYAQTGKII